jgi:general secretion pathway protein D
MGGRRRSGGGGSANRAGGNTAARSSAGATDDVQPFEQQVVINRYEQTNSLLIVASPQDYKILSAFIAQLDVPQRQVFVEVTVMDVSTVNDFALKVDLAGLDSESVFGVTSTASLAGLNQVSAIANVLASGADADLANAIAMAGMADTILGMGTGGITGGIFHDISTSVGGVDVKLPFVPLVVNALETLTDVEILSQPSITVVDNESASFLVGQEIPTISASSSPSRDSDGNISNVRSNFGTRIERQDVGVKVDVTPQISEGDNVLLELEIEVSDIATNQVGDVNTVGVTTNKSKFTNKVLIMDGSTAVIAGLTRDTTNRAHSQAPIIGDLPLVGWLFKNKSNAQRKQNMVVLVTPHVIKERIDIERITEETVQNYHQVNLEEFFRGGFFKKVKTKFDARKNHRPTLEKSEALTGRRANQKFGRGDMKR